MLFSSFIDTLSVSIDARDKITSGHSKRVTLYANLICEKCKLSEEEKTASEAKTNINCLIIFITQ